MTSCPRGLGWPHGLAGEAADDLVLGKVDVGAKQDAAVVVHDFVCLGALAHTNESHVLGVW